ncbi:hypothetical protein VT84_30305 [Gemmata sp. SH-PL17]|uniref:hypothetical protein n=1 Tax=Gemmata sp. SH-PL17 TaxID=1630693 RepID=UPI00078D05E9|nr:hypothetical protein [Gemmata sp. SH-PL17]AMV28737.1 hypothetical protein VT84_30305 [Gemmata sp. SH-PL17]
MRKRIAAAGLGVLLGTTSVSAQPVPPATYPPATYPLPGSTLPAPAGLPAFPGSPTVPNTPTAPGLLPPLAPNKLPIGAPSPTFPPGAPGNFMPSTPTTAPGTSVLPKPPVAVSPSELPLPQQERKIAMRATDVAVKRVVGGWEVWAGQHVLRNTGDNETGARDVARVMRELRPTEWITVGATKPVVEYGLTNGRPAVSGTPPVESKDSKNGNFGSVANASGTTLQMGATAAQFVQQIDLRSTRVEAIRGVWCVRDENNILLNFGTDKGGAEQASAAIQKYGFNRMGVVGTPTQPVMSYLFVSLEQPKAVPGGQLMLSAQIDALSRTGIPIPGVGFTGEMVKLDPNKVEARKDGAEWVVAFGPEVLGRFGPTEWSAREAARTIRDAKFTEFCKLSGSTGVTFFLTNEKAPTRAPFNAQGRNFDPAALKVQQINNKWAVTDAGRQVFEVASAQEGETIVRVMKAYGFDQTAHLSAGGSKGGISFLVKSTRR